jgi:hypothetical protein
MYNNVREVVFQLCRGSGQKSLHCQTRGTGQDNLSLAFRYLYRCIPRRTDKVIKIQHKHAIDEHSGHSDGEGRYHFTASKTVAKSRSLFRTEID